MAHSKKKFLKHTIAGGAAAILSGALGAVSLAQNTPITRFDNDYLSGHPEVAQ